MDRYHGPSLVVQKAAEAVNDDLYDAPSLRAGRQTDLLKRFIEKEVARLLEEIWARGSEPDLDDDRRKR
jgi:hypothetical protein